MSYVVESASSRRARRRRRTAITLLVVVALLAFAFYYAASYWNKDPEAAAGACPTTTSSVTSTVTPKAGASTTAPAARPAALTNRQITVNVYNATTRGGLAGDTAKLVKARGFVVGTIANDPLKKSIAGTAEVRYGKNGAAAAAVVLKQVTGAKGVVDARADASVDLVLGNGFTALATVPTATPSAGATTSGC